MHENKACHDEEPLVRSEVIREKLCTGAAGFEALLRQGLPRYQFNKRVLRFRWTKLRHGSGNINGGMSESHEKCHHSLNLSVTG